MTFGETEVCTMRALNEVFTLQLKRILGVKAGTFAGTQNAKESAKGTQPGVN
jgi:hypothetical protein